MAAYLNRRRDRGAITQYKAASGQRRKNARHGLGHTVSCQESGTDEG
jgi:hypothetical protein